MSTQLTLPAHGRSRSIPEEHFPSRILHVNTIAYGKDDQTCTQLSRAIRIGRCVLNHGNIYFHAYQTISDGIYNSLTTVHTEFAPAIPTPVSPVSCLSRHWPQPPIPAEVTPSHSRGMTKPNLTFSPLPYQAYLPTPPATPSTAGPVPFMFTLPNETLDRIFSFLSTTALPTFMRSNKLCHALAERRLYFKVQHLQLYESQDNEDNKSWQCLRTLASRTSAATSVRHFAVRGLPWLSPSEMDLIIRALRNMTNLCSLHLELGVPFERALVRDPFAISAIAGSLCALNVTDAQTATAFCGSVSASRGRDPGLESPSAPPRPLATLRIAPESALNAAAVHDLVLALTRGKNGPRTGDLQVLQLAVEAESEDELLKILSDLGASLPSLETLGIQVGRIGQGEKICDQNLEESRGRISNLSRRMGGILAIFPSLRRFSLASMPYASLSIEEAQEDAEALVAGCQRLELLELYWSVWHVQTMEGNQHWAMTPPPPGHPFIRRNWVYEHASVS